MRNEKTKRARGRPKTLSDGERLVAVSIALKRDVAKALAELAEATQQSRSSVAARFITAGLARSTRAAGKAGTTTK